METDAACFVTAQASPPSDSEDEARMQGRNSSGGEESTGGGRAAHGRGGDSGDDDDDDDSEDSSLGSTSSDDGGLSSDDGSGGCPHDEMGGGGAGEERARNGAEQEGDEEDDEEEVEEDEEDAVRDASLLLFRQHLEDQRQKSGMALQALAAAEASHWLETIRQEEFDFAQSVVDGVKSALLAAGTNAALALAVLVQLRKDANDLLLMGDGRSSLQHQSKRRRTTAQSEDGLRESSSAAFATAQAGTPASTTLFRRLVGVTTTAVTTAQGRAGEGDAADSPPLPTRRSILESLNAVETLGGAAA